MLRCLAILLAFALLAPAVGAAQDDQCLSATPPAPTAPPRPLRFGITPQLAGSAGVIQLGAAPVVDARTLAALRALRPPGRALVLRLNRMFWSDGDAGLRRYAELVDGYAAAGFQTELQVRYHPPSGHDGDIPGWLDYVRRAVRTFAPRRSVVELSITNEANLPLSSNTSDGTYKNVLDAIVQGVVAARQEADRLGRPDLALGFTYAYRSSPQGDDQFFTGLGQRATPAFRAALDHVGIQLYPGLFYPPASTDPASDTIEALTLLRDCWLPKAGIGARTAIWVTENGYATRGGAGTDAQAADLRATVDAVSRWSGTLGVTDYRYFNLRDNNSHGSDLFDSVGLLFDDYAPKPAFAAYRDEVARLGAPVAAAAAPSARPRLRIALRPRRVRRRRRVAVTVTVTAAGRPAAGAHVWLAGRRATADRRGHARMRLRLVGRPGRRTVRATRRGAVAARATLRVLA